MNAENWTVKYDSLGLSVNIDYTNITEGTAKNEGEDIFQAQSNADPSYIINLGWYRTVYAVMLVIDEEWDDPHKRWEFTTFNEAATFLNYALEETPKSL